MAGTTLCNDARSRETASLLQGKSGNVMGGFRAGESCNGEGEYEWRNLGCLINV
jgi:hypothetical protein